MNLPLVSWVNGTIMIGIFALVCVGLVAIVILMMKADKKTQDDELVQNADSLPEQNQKERL